MLLHYQAKYGNTKIAYFTHAVLLLCQTSISRGLISSLKSMPMLLCDTLYLAINGVQLWAVGWAITQESYNTGCITSTTVIWSTATVAEFTVKPFRQYCSKYSINKYKYKSTNTLRAVPLYSAYLCVSVLSLIHI